jgi:adenosylhomocysteinase
MTRSYVNDLTSSFAEDSVKITDDLSAQAAATRFFQLVMASTPSTRTQVVLVAHALPSQLWFVEALKRRASLAAVLPKPKSAHEATLQELRAAYRCEPLNRSTFADASFVLERLESWAGGQPVVLLDIGGYFASTLNDLCSRYSGRIVGVVEDTENGLRRYERIEELACPVYSVARSPLKQAEDTLVGESIVFSAEALLRAAGVILPGRRACVLGFGKIGASIARTLRARNVHTTVVDADPVRLIHASVGGFAVASSVEDALPKAQLVFSATGNRALSAVELALVRNGAFIVSATSRDDEFGFGLDVVKTLFRHENVAPQITRYQRDGRHFHLVNEGNAVNFLHGSEVGPSIHLVQAEILSALARLTSQPHAPGLYEVSPAKRTEIARRWLEIYHAHRTPSTSTPSNEAAA